MSNTQSRFSFVKPTKLCAACKQEKPRSAFYGNKNERGYLDRQCKDCRLQEMREKHENFIKQGKSALARNSGKAFVAAREVFCARIKQRIDQIDEVLSWPDAKEPGDEKGHALGPRERDIMLARRDEACMLIDKIFRMDAKAVASAPHLRYNPAWLNIQPGNESDFGDCEQSEVDASSAGLSSPLSTEKTGG